MESTFRYEDHAIGSGDSLRSQQLAGHDLVDQGTETIFFFANLDHEGVDLRSIVCVRQKSTGVALPQEVFVSFVHLGITSGAAGTPVGSPASQLVTPLCQLRDGVRRLISES